MELMNQPFTGQLGNRLIELLGTEDYHTLNIIVAFAKNSGVLRIKNALEKFRERGGIVNVYVGVDLGGTSYEALTALLLQTDSLNVVHTEKGQTFHSKIFQFLGQDKGLLVVGSHNLTGGGLWTNFESSVIVSVDKTNTDNIQILKTMDDYFSDLRSLGGSFMKISSQSDIEKLLKNSYVSKEVVEQINRAKAVTQNLERESLFGKGIAVKLPRIITLKKDEVAVAAEVQAELIPIPVDDKDQTIWFETRRLTGGSRNILDLSMRSLVERGDPKGTPFEFGDPKFMRGGVEFFGLNPAATKEVKNITINFEGIDYVNNTILFPDGENANGTWRLQIKGTSDSQQKITDAFRAKGDAHYLVEKIITFTKVKDDYYFLSVFPESELEAFKAASLILAYNGSTKSAKYLGLL